MLTDTKVRIVSYIKTNGQAKVKDLATHLALGNVAIHRQLKKLVAAGQLAKVGTPPKVFYVLANRTLSSPSLPANALLDNYFAYVDPTGHLNTGLAGFRIWLKNVGKVEQEQSLLKRYALDRTEANSLFNSAGLIDATVNIGRTFNNEMNLDRVFYLDFYSLPTFGKTRLGTSVLYAKQSENQEMIRQLAGEAQSKLTPLITDLGIEAVGFLPHSILRKVQFLKEFADRLNLTLPKIELIKAYPGEIRVAQKTLGRLEERIQNARETIFVNNNKTRFKRVLLIDDAVGSAATLNETARKLKNMGIAQEVYGFAIVGSLKGFEVIREV
ncbi:hypothetical protein A3A54_00780 [Candidatus Curtissbacteria bacterium RIFCSPLOWO2_01_FULL_39_62]|uniref:HTH arsR-type domain-containing protein n=1 Tax=Candidatus Yanofskybacteria bacterium RIFCSPHIGHO2_02_FULL_43_22 TaxID=1802681 RepID=A0A1F8FLA2_9BACT|nr:MAG: hypothetical protein UW86_C0027G0006 [Microgenomates group bacterium GW2011_GWA1_Microgenomates_45_10]OGE01581.1 MAG: hypothetical protein A3A54_00780 [Candidatus Curtissbacteria bacterium RIFCSPLOWO2_01_FULL_39_62]OGN13895.1 MAG: hypothetical protein A3J47_00725 [Candidatus Yanofskybacteria bacterium RIFCSPHIGHO2_02_FULL_43_22]